MKTFWTGLMSWGLCRCLISLQAFHLYMKRSRRSYGILEIRKPIHGAGRTGQLKKKDWRSDAFSADIRALFRKVDRAIKELQQYFYITVAGNRRKTDKSGQAYGWPSNVYDKVENWVLKEWMSSYQDLSRDEAVEIILDTGVGIGENLNRDMFARAIGL